MNNLAHDHEEQLFQDGILLLWSILEKYSSFQVHGYKRQSNEHFWQPCKIVLEDLSSFDYHSRKQHSCKALQIGSYPQLFLSKKFQDLYSAKCWAKSFQQRRFKKVWKRNADYFPFQLSLKFLTSFLKARSLLVQRFRQLETQIVQAIIHQHLQSNTRSLSSDSILPSLRLLHLEFTRNWWDWVHNSLHSAWSFKVNQRCFVRRILHGRSQSLNQVNIHIDQLRTWKINSYDRYSILWLCYKNLLFCLKCPLQIHL